MNNIRFKLEDLSRKQLIKDLGDQLWEFDADTTIRILSPKVLRSDSCEDLYPPLQSFDFLVDVVSVREIMDFMPEPGAINFMSSERFNHLPLSVFLNECAANCDNAYRKLLSAGVTFRGSLIQPINKRWSPMCRFHVYDKQTNSKDVVPNSAALKPDLAGVASTTSAKLPAIGVCQRSRRNARSMRGRTRRRSSSLWRSMGIGMRLLDRPERMLARRSTRCPLRLFSIVIGVNH